MATFGEPAEDVNSLMFLDVGVEDPKSNSVNAGAKVVPRMTHNAVELEDRWESVSVH